MSYQNATVHNSTAYPVTGKVLYRTFFCSDDDYTVAHGQTWEASSRGVCLITKVSATVEDPNGPIEAEPYSSGGSIYSNFAVISTGTNQYTVVRVGSQMEDMPPADYVEPTQKQK